MAEHAVKVERDTFEPARWLVYSTRNGYQWNSVGISFTDAQRAGAVAALLQEELDVQSGAGQ